MRPRILLLEDDPVCRKSLNELVQSQGFDTEVAGTLSEARKAVDQNTYTLALIDLKLPDGSGMELMDYVHQAHPSMGCHFVVVSGNEQTEMAVDAMKRGAEDYLTKPIEIPRLRAILDRFRKLAPERPENFPSDEMSGSIRNELIEPQSASMRRVMKMVQRVAPTDATVLIVGESGTGKEVIAETIHQRSPRRSQPFVPVNCGAISPSLIESELFGHERGSFTGAHARHEGYFEQANGGTLFLDEITEMDPEMQTKLLRVLETGTIRRVGGHHQLDVNVRLVAATNQSPQESVKSGKLREDLYYRINEFPIEIPALRDRREDIRGLSEYFIHELNRHYQADKHLTAEALERIEQYDWPGNVRELKNILHRAFIISDEQIDVGMLETILPGPHADASKKLVIPIGTSMIEAENQLLIETLNSFQGNKRKTAEVLKISLKTLYNRLHVLEK